MRFWDSSALVTVVRRRACDGRGSGTPDRGPAGCRRVDDLRRVCFSARAARARRSACFGRRDGGVSTTRSTRRVLVRSRATRRNPGSRSPPPPRPRTARCRRAATCCCVRRLRAAAPHAGSRDARRSGPSGGAEGRFRAEADEAVVGSVVDWRRDHTPGQQQSIQERPHVLRNASRAGGIGMDSIWPIHFW